MSMYTKLNDLILNIELVLSPPDKFYTMLIKKKSLFRQYLILRDLNYYKKTCSEWKVYFPNGQASGCVYFEIRKILKTFILNIPTAPF